MADITAITVRTAPAYHGHITTHLTPEAVALLQQTATAMHKALAVLQQAQHRALTVADLHAVTGPTMRSATAVKRACTATEATLRNHKTPA